MSPEGITKLIEQQDKEILSIREDVLKMCWYMRGGVTYEEGMNLSVSERNIVSDIIKDNLETTKKSGLPFY
jgi:hypothetical protein